MLFVLAVLPLIVAFGRSDEIPKPHIPPPPLPPQPIAAVNRIECGLPMVQMQRVIGGKPAVYHSWPWQVLMVRKGQTHCGGSILSSKFIVTAAHCVTRHYNINDLEVRVGVTTKYDRGQRYKIKKIVIHHRFSPYTLSHDIAMLELEKPIKFGIKARPVCLPQMSVPVGKKCYITGWGRMEDRGDPAVLLQQAVVPIVSQRECQRKNFKNLHMQVTNDMICAGDGGQTNKGGCQGDSGGPLVCEVDGRWFLHGAVSHGSGDCDSKKAYTVFARITFFKHWIEAVMSS